MKTEECCALSLYDVVCHVWDSRCLKPCFEAMLRCDSGPCCGVSASQCTPGRAQAWVWQRRSWASGARTVEVRGVHHPRPNSQAKQTENSKIRVRREKTKIRKTAKKHQTGERERCNAVTGKRTIFWYFWYVESRNLHHMSCQMFQFKCFTLQSLQDCGAPTSLRWNCGWEDNWTLLRKSCVDKSNFRYMKSIWSDDSWLHADTPINYLSEIWIHAALSKSWPVIHWISIGSKRFVFFGGNGLHLEKLIGCRSSWTLSRTRLEPKRPCGKTTGDGGKNRHLTEKHCRIVMKIHEIFSNWTFEVTDCTILCKP